MPLHPYDELVYPPTQRMVRIDQRLTPLMVYLWMRGSRTSACCQGDQPGDNWSRLSEGTRLYFIPEVLGGRVKGMAHLTMEDVIAHYNDTSARAGITFDGVTHLEFFLHQLPIGMQRRIKLPREDPARWDAHFAHVEQQAGIIFNVSLSFPYADLDGIYEHLDLGPVPEDTSDTPGWQMTQWGVTTIKDTVGCTGCGVTKGEPCVRIRGPLAGTVTTNPHVPRRKAAIALGWAPNRVITCGVPSLTLGPCDLPRGHEGEQHASADDGFYARCGMCRNPLKAGDWHVTTADRVLGYVCGGCRG